MIYYFSATGNSRYVAETLSRYFHDPCVSIEDFADVESVDCYPAPGESVGIVSPTYAWGLPVNVREFLEKLVIKAPGQPYLYFVATYGKISGTVDLEVIRILKKTIRRSPDALFGVKMPDTWTPIFDLSSRAKTDKINSAADKQIHDMTELIRAGKERNYIKNKAPELFSFVHKPVYNHLRQTKYFHVEESCIGCGQCAKNCPAHAIEMKDGHPVWVKDRCIACLRCLHHCPEFAIQYGTHTKKHGQYAHK
ncbi:MAG: EFR1 family ferrodoxin [Lachnospiraceae bacterium]|jgi:NAD-dependent dihydropyrimidine dehydrogenase PreA subunit|nr:EFR1 family ferrodoxin [Lachnospiraceae bacterium]MCI1334497.1 EFR1 family ferrodoxin [Lachnospiraceae bacterium]MCI1358732.1 EFR1 family ferrodoxin [Lachnospiraceae bacterium]MCI1379372.1 EFR1 family ferrodoxin [Lachnospiraceae bacterium]MCI1455476.1 EFR1 family ferrodoxin [Lachnospiraceae bacterium]